MRGTWGVGLSVILGVGCVRTPPAPEANGPVDLPAPVAKEDGRVVLAAAPGDEAAGDAGGPRASLAGKTVLHVGDSMVGGLGGLTKSLEARFTAEGATMIHDHKVSESIVSFDKSSRLQDLLTRHEPDIVIITLGTNDALVPHPQAYAQNVRNIAKRVSARECYWIGPPLWKKDTGGIVAVLRENVAPCRFFDSSKLDIKRQSDGVHPTGSGGAEWAGHFWRYLKATRSAPVSDR
jgi:lysophospholipase L1-like esterase